MASGPGRSDTLLSDEEKAMREVAHDVATNEIRPAAESADRNQQFPEEVWDTLAELEMTAITVPETYGGLDVDRLTYSLINEEI
ncbi:MAG: acyl-CoA dehydrogenase family protein, partial [Halobacteriaceae archaeon]